jgi:hypothetical protein
MARAELRFGFLGDGGVEERGSSGERCRVERRWCCPFIGRRGKGERRAEAVAELDH